MAHKKDDKRFYDYRSLLNGRDSLFNIIIVERGKGRVSQKWLRRRKKRF